MNRHKITEHFCWEDICCKHCQHIIISDLLFAHMEALERLRQSLGFAMIINSGWRCIIHNEHVGGKPSSMHLKFATDIRADNYNKKNTARIATAAPDFGFKGIGTAINFIHLDMRDQEATWTY